MTPQARSGHLAMLCFSVLVAGSFALGVLAANDITPLALNAVRFWIASAIIGFLVALRGGVPRAALTAPWRYLVLASALTFYFVMMFEGLKTAPSVSAAAVFTLTPMIAAGFGWLLLGQRMHRRIKVALAIGAVGALWVIFRADVAALMRFEVGRGEMIYFTGCVSHALYTPLVRKLNRGEGALVFTFGTLVTGAVILTIVGWLDHDSLYGDFRECGDVYLAAILGDAPACGKGDGLHLFGAVLGDCLERCAGRSRAAAGHFRRRCTDDCGVVLAVARRRLAGEFLREESLECIQINRVHLAKALHPDGGGAQSVGL